MTVILGAAAFRCVARSSRASRVGDVEIRAAAELRP
jgi:hypothetical protein